MVGKIVRAIGNLLIILVILACIPVAIPKLFGIQGYNVISGSMEPTISVGSIVYVKSASFNELKKGDIIAYEAGASVVTHRIEAINDADKLITTKGDANETPDFLPVAYVNVIGKVAAHFPVYGYIASWISDTVGKIVLVILLIVGVILSSAGPKKEAEKINPKAILALGLVIIFGSMGGFLYIFMGYQKSDNLYAGISDSYVKVAESTPELSWEDMIDVDFDSLKSINPDVIGWIYVEGTDISYPIMYSGDDEGYLRTSIDGEYAKAGSIFLEGYNLPTMEDSHSIIYGHNMRNLSMFGTLKYYKADESYLSAHKYFQIITPGEKMRFEIFSYFDTEAASWVYAVPYAPGEDFDNYISELLRHSYRQIKSKADVDSSDRIVTLSTCSSEGMRFTVHGVMTESVKK